MQTASIIILVLSHAGRWLAGTDGTVSVRWTVPDQTPRAMLVWDLLLGSNPLGHGSVAIKPGDHATDFNVRCPRVRTRVVLEFRYRLTTADGKQELASGTSDVQAFPDDLTSGWASLLAGKNLTVLDTPDGLPAILTKAGVACHRMDDPSDLQLDHPGIILVAADRLDDSPFSQGVLLEQAAAGANVLVFQQTHVDRLNGCTVDVRARPETVDWKTTHPLLARLSADDLNSWIADLSPEVPSIRLVPDSMSMTIATLPAGTPDIITPEIITPDKGDSLLAIQRIGRGRIVWCQLRLGSWTTDPRSQILLGNALDDLSTPAVAGSQRRRSTVAPEHTVPVIRTRFPMVLTPGGDER